MDSAVKTSPPCTKESGKYQVGTMARLEEKGWGDTFTPPS